MASTNGGAAGFAPIASTGLQQMAGHPRTSTALQQVTASSVAANCGPDCVTTVPVETVSSTPSISSCTPQCTWACDSPKCDEVCTPKCKPPVCETRCPNTPDLSQCCIECDQPQCSVQCPASACPNMGCPQCTTSCSEPHCKLTCSGEQSCQTVCEHPDCEWECSAPTDCPAPKCQMMCEQPPDCMGSTYQQLPPLQSGEMSVQSFEAGGKLTSLLQVGMEKSGASHISVKANFRPHAAYGLHADAQAFSQYVSSAPQTLFVDVRLNRSSLASNFSSAES